MLTARFESVPESHDGSTAFTFELHFSEDIPALSYKTVTGGLFEVTGANVTGARRLTRGSNQGWLVTVAPNGSGDIAVSLPARACGETAAICAADGRTLSESIAATVVGTHVAGTPFVASFDTVPDEHDGSTRFTFHLLMSHEAHGLSYRTVRDALFDVSGGRVTGARRLTSGKNQNWAVTVEPSSTADVVVAVRGTESCDAANAVCTANRHKLPGEASITVPDPATLSVADAEVREGPDATLDFVVTLSRNRHEATAGADYTAASGTLTLAAGETSKTVSVAVLDDALDEGSETLTLTLTNPEPSSVRLADAEATGTIRNTDKMPKAWIARFGREAASHVVDAIVERLRVEPQPHVVLGGQKLSFEADSLLLDGGLRGNAPALGAWNTGAAERASLLAQYPDSRLAGSPGRSLNRRTGEDAKASWRKLDMNGLLLASSFHLASAENMDSGSRWSVWGRGKLSSFEGREDALRLSGDVTTATLGVDLERERWLVGVTLSRSAGEGSFKTGGACEVGCSGEVESTLAGLYPYVRYRVSQKLSLWGVIGHGQGDLTLKPAGVGSLETDIEMSMAAAGARGVLLPASESGGFELALRTDVFVTSTSSEAAANLVETEAETSRIRLLLEGSRAFRFGKDAVLTPSFQVGVRHDGGDAKTGGGLEVGGSLRYAAKRLTIEISARGLLTHQESDYEEWGVSGSIRLGSAEQGRGLSMRLGSAWGAESGGAERLWAQRYGGFTPMRAGKPRWPTGWTPTGGF